MPSLIQPCAVKSCRNYVYPEKNMCLEHWKKHEARRIMKLNEKRKKDWTERTRRDFEKMYWKYQNRQDDKFD